MATPKDIKFITDQAGMNRLLDEHGGIEFFSGCKEVIVQDDYFTAHLRQTVRKQHLEYYKDGALVGVAFRYTLTDGSIRFSPKMLWIDGVRHCC